MRPTHFPARATIATLAFVLLPAQAPGAVLPRGRFEVHVRNLPQAAFANALVIETSAHVVVIDAGFSDEEAESILAVVRSLGKPIDSILLTHGHVDHYGGIGRLRRGGIPVITSDGVARQIAELDATNYARFGARPPEGRGGVDLRLADGESRVVDEVRFTLHDAGPGESFADAWWEIEGGGRRAAALGDLAMYGLPPFLQSGHSRDWLATLARLEHALPPETRLYLGHDVEAAGNRDPGRDVGVLRWQAARLRAFRAAVAKRGGGARLLSPAEIDAVAAELRLESPETLAAFDFLISASANVLAAELVRERADAELEASLQALFARSEP